MRMTFRQFRNGLVGVILRAVGLWRDIPPPGGTRVGGPGGAGRQSGCFFANEGETWVRDASQLAKPQKRTAMVKSALPPAPSLSPTRSLASILPSFLPSPFLAAQRAKSISHVNSRSLALWARTKFSAWLRRRWEPWGARLPCSFWQFFVPVPIDWLSSSSCCSVVLVVFVLFSPSPPHLPPFVGLKQILCAAVSVFPALGACCFSLFLERQRTLSHLSVRFF